MLVLRGVVRAYRLKHCQCFLGQCRRKEVNGPSQWTADWLTLDNTASLKWPMRGNDIESTGNTDTGTQDSGYEEVVQRGAKCLGQSNKDGKLWAGETTGTTEEDRRRRGRLSVER